MKILKIILVILIIIFTFSCKSKDKKNDNDNPKDEDVVVIYNSDTIVIKNFADDISTIPKKTIPLKIMLKDFQHMDSTSNIYIDKNLFGDKIEGVEKYKALFQVDLENKLKLILVETITVSEDNYFYTNYRYLILSDGQIKHVSYPLISEDLTDESEFLGISIKKDKYKIEIGELYKNDILNCLDTSGLGLSDEEKYDLLTSETIIDFNFQGIILEKEENISENQDNGEPIVYEGKIGDLNVVMEIIDSENDEYVDYGKIFVKDNNLGVLLSTGYIPIMCFSTNYFCFSSNGKLNAAIDFIVVDKLLGHLKLNDDDLPVKMKLSDKTFDELVSNSVVSKIHNTNFKKYISHFAESKTDFTLDAKVFDESGVELMKIDNHFKVKYLDENLFVSSYKGGENYYTYFYGFVFNNGDDLTCIIPVKISYLNGGKGEYRYLFIDYSFEGEIKSFDILDKIPQKLSMRGYDVNSDEPKDLFMQESFGNDMMNNINIFIDIPSGIDVDELIVYAQTGQDFIETENEKKQIFSHNLKSYNHPHIYAFNLNSNLDCNDLFFEIKDSKGKLILKKRFNMHCGE